MVQVVDPASQLPEQQGLVVQSYPSATPPATVHEQSIHGAYALVVGGR